MPSLLNKRPDLPFTLFLFACTTIYLAAALQIRAQFSEGVVGPRFLPILSAVIVYVGLLALLFGKSGPRATTSARALLKPLLVVIATGGFIALFKPLGYLATTTLFSAAILWVFEFQRSRPIVLATGAVAITAAFYLLFSAIFGVRLPLMPGFF